MSDGHEREHAQTLHLCPICGKTPDETWGAPYGAITALVEADAVIEAALWSSPDDGEGGAS